MRLSLIAVPTVLLLAAVSVAGGDVAYLRNGESMEITGFRLEGDFVYLEMAGGGQVALPNTEVREIRRSPGPTLSAPAGGEEPTPADREGSSNVPPTPTGEGRATGLPTELPAGAVFDTAELRKLAGRVARRHGLSEALVQAVVQVESRYDAFAVSPRGAMGLMQLMPQTARRFKVDDVFNPVDNLDGGVRYLKELLDRYRGETQLALAAYNAGEKAVERYGGIPPYRETMQYVDRVLSALSRP